MCYLLIYVSMAILLSLVETSTWVPKDLHISTQQRNEEPSRDLDIHNVHEVGGHPYSLVFARSAGPCFSCVRSSRRGSPPQASPNQRKSSENKSPRSKSGEGSMQQSDPSRRKSGERKSASPKTKSKQEESHRALTMIMQEERLKQQAAKFQLEKEKKVWDKAAAKEDQFYPTNLLPHEKYRYWQPLSPGLGGNKGQEPRKTMGHTGHFIEKIGALDKNLQQSMHTMVKPLERPWFPPTKQSLAYAARARTLRKQLPLKKLARSKSAPQLLERPSPPTPEMKSPRWGWPPHMKGRTHSFASSDYIDEFDSMYIE